MKRYQPMVAETEYYESDDGVLVYYDEAQAEIDALKAELAASISAREEMQLGGNRIAESLRFAKEKIADLKAELAALKAPPKVLSAEEVTEPGWYWHTRKGWGGDWFIHKVVRYGVLDELHTLGNCFSYDRLDGQFVGPLKAPEV